MSEPTEPLPAADVSCNEAAGLCTCNALRRPHRWGIKWCLRPERETTP